MVKRISIILMLLATVTVARAFDFSQTLPSGQTLYFDITGSTVRVVNPDWDYYVMPAGTLVIPATVSNGGTDYAVTSIGQSAFEGCAGLTRVVVPEGVTSIAGFAFYRCTALDTIELPSTLTEILSQAFSYTAYASNPDNRDEYGVLYVGDYVIGGGNTAVIEVRAGTLGIAGMAFYYTHTLEHVTLPASLRFIAGQAFSDCIALDTVRCLSEVPPQALGNTFLQTPAFTVAVPCGSSAAYSADAVWGTYDIVEDCAPQPVDVVSAIAPRVVRMPGGVTVFGAEGCALAVSDLLGRRVATVASASAAQRIALPAAGLYLLSAEGAKPVKILYSE